MAAGDDAAVPQARGATDDNRGERDPADIGPLKPASSSLPILIGSGLALAALVAGIAAFAVIGLARAPLSPSAAASNSNAAAVATGGPSAEDARRDHRLTSRAWALWHDVSYNALQPIGELDRLHRRFQPAQVFQPGYEVIDSATLQSDQTRIHLAYLAALPAETICLSAEATKFACGLMGRASLSLIVSGAPLGCYPDVSIDSDKAAYLCQSRGRDVALTQLDAGFALPANQSVAFLSTLTATARIRHSGAWNGDWTILPPGGETVANRAPAP
jgi:hypothetical protein